MFVIYEGPSELNGQPIVAILTGFSANRKTGDMHQVFILAKNTPPVEAIKSKEEESVCGDCKHRGTTCYVNAGQSVTTVYRAYKRGKYQALPKNWQPHKPIRFGAYGDIAAVPRWAYEHLLAFKFTNYTHQWHKFNLQEFSMASVDSLKEKEDAKKLGYRTFRVSTDANKDIQPDEIICPADRGIQCRDCLLCSGTSKKAKNIVITVHGVQHKIDKFIKYSEQ